jgi:hypothetical protein
MCAGPNLLTPVGGEHPQRPAHPSPSVRFTRPHAPRAPIASPRKHWGWGESGRLLETAQRLGGLVEDLGEHGLRWSVGLEERHVLGTPDMLEKGSGAEGAVG